VLLQKSETELAQIKDALVASQELLNIRTDELQKCQTSLDMCSQEMKDVRVDFATLQQDSDASQSLVCTLRTELSSTHQKMEELQLQLEKSRAATAHARLSRLQLCERRTQPRGNDDSVRAAPATGLIQSPEAVDMSALVHQLDVAHKRLNKATKVHSHN